MCQIEVLFQQLEQIHHMTTCWETYGSKQQINNESIPEE